MINKNSTKNHGDLNCSGKVEPFIRVTPAPNPTKR